jgi:dTDP-4-dehydrorhamnose reductase
MKIVLFGSNGMLGEYLKSYLSKKYDVLSLTRKDIDLSVIDESSLMNFLKNNVSKDDIIINGCGIIKQRDYKPIEMIMVNSVFPNLLAKFKKDIDCKIIHITTDCVFSGSRGLYVETDKHDCLDDYGKSKSLGENPLLTTIRTSIIGEEKSNKKSLLEWVISNRNKTIDGYDNHLWNGVTCLELSKFISEMIENNNFWEGVKHIFSPSTLSKYELVNIINDV